MTPERANEILSLQDEINRQGHPWNWRYPTPQEWRLRCTLPEQLAVERHIVSRYGENEVGSGSKWSFAITNFARGHVDLATGEYIQPETAGSDIGVVGSRFD